MHSSVGIYLSSLQFGDIQHFAKMAVTPLFVPDGGDGPEYLTLARALETRTLTVTEISEGGSVPELKVVNQGDMPVLLLDGEELMGAKQNRVLNTTILLKEHAETVIPVSCTEQGRWAYSSAEFADSGVVASPRLRRMSSASVSASLAREAGYSSDQGAIWEEIRRVSGASGVRSDTSAMREVFRAREKELHRYLRAFPLVARQRGLFIFVNGKALGFDVLSREHAYADLHPKLVKSYALEAILENEEGSSTPHAGVAGAFLEEAGAAPAKGYASVGLGSDYRFRGKELVGSALVYRDTVIHAAFFRATPEDTAGRMSGFRRRRDFRL